MPLDAARVDVTASDVLAASARLRRYLPPTPLHYAERFGCWLKLENLQRTGAYKVRGALNALLAARERGDRRTVITASAGNHAMGLAWAARELKVPVITVMPVTAPVVKAQGVAFLGATVRQSGQTYDEAKAHALQLAEQHGFRYLSAFDDPDVIAGQGTLGIELAAHAPEAVLVPIGGGGLAAGVALALKSQGVRIIGAQVEGVDAMARALKGDASPIEPKATLADGTRVAEAGTLTRDILSRLLDDLIIVREAELRETLARLMLEEHIVAEGAGALALAAGRRVASRRKVAVVSGGNIDAAVFAQLLLDTRPRPPRPPRRRAADPFTAEAPASRPAPSPVAPTTGSAFANATPGRSATAAVPLPGIAASFSKTPEGSLP
jgi:threonine dehydratase